PTEPATDIEHALARRERGEIRDLDRRLPASNVEFVDRREIERRQTREILPLIRQRAQDGAEDSVPGVVIGNRVEHGISGSAQAPERAPALCRCGDSPL